MLKHVQVSPHRNRSDSVSLRSSISCSSSLCGSPEPPGDNIQRTPSRASSYCSLNDALPQTTIKVYTACLRIDIEYKTLGIQWDTTSKEVVHQLLKRCKVRHRDPKLFYLSMEVAIRCAGIKTVMVLEDDARPAVLQACHSKGDTRFCLQMKPGGLVRVHTTALLSTSFYKSLMIAEDTTSDELLGLLLGYYNSTDPVEQFSLYEVCPGQEFQRKLHPDDSPLRAQQLRKQKGESCHFLVRRNPNYPKRKQLLPPIIEKTTSMSSINSITSSGESNRSSDSFEMTPTDHLWTKITEFGGCQLCHNEYKSCEFCNDVGDQGVTIRANNSTSLQDALMTANNNNNSTIAVNRNTMNMIKSTSSYNPVYNIREIRSACHSFSAFGKDRHLIDIERLPFNMSGFNKTTNRNKTQSDLIVERVNNDPSKGFGNFVYI